MHRTLALALALAMAWTSAGSARSWQVDDLSHLEDIGQAEFDPAGRYLLVEHLRPRVEMTRFDMDDWGEIGRSVPLVFDLAKGGLPHPLLSIAPRSGYALGSISPDGSRVVVYRLQDHSYTLGVVEVASGRTKWLGVTPELGRWGRQVEWLSSTRLAAVVRPDRSLPLDLRMGFEAPQVLSRLSRTQAEGREASVIAIGSGRYGDLRPKAAPDQLVVFDLSADTKRMLASGAFVDFAVSNDRRYMGLITDGADIQYLASQTLKVGTPAFRRSLTMVDLQSGQVSQPAPGYDLLTHLLAWAPNSDRLLVYGRTGDSAWADGRLLVVDAVHDTVEAPTEVVADVLGDMGDVPMVEADWDGEVPLLYGHVDRGMAARSDWFRLEGSAPHNLTSTLPAPLDLLTVGTDAMVLHAGDGFWRVDRDGHWTKFRSPSDAAALTPHTPDEGLRFIYNNRPRRDWVWVREAHKDAVSLIRLGQPTSAPLEITNAARVLATDNAGDRVVSIVRDAHGVLRLGLHGVAGYYKPLLRLNTDLNEIEPAAVHPVHHMSGNGRSVTSWLYLPANLKRDERPALLVSAYPSAAYTAAPEAEDPGLSSISDSLANAQILTGKGYAVLVVSMPDRPDLADPADGFEPDILRAVDAAGATGLVDTSRLAFWGHSYGGYAALELATRSSRFGAIIASGAPSDLASDAGDFTPFIRFQPADGLWINARAGWLEDGQAQLHTQAWTNPDRYVRNSPVFSAGAIKTPILLISGGIDPVVAAGQGEEMFSSLYRQDKSAILLTYFGEGHMIHSPANLKDLYERVFKFLNDSLGAVRRPADS